MTKAKFGAEALTFLAVDDIGKFPEGSTYDMTIVSPGLTGTFFVHKVILANGSDYFYQLFSKECPTVIRICHCSDAVCLMLHWLYREVKPTGHCLYGDLHTEYIETCFLADYYRIDGLWEWSMAKCCSHMNDSNFANYRPLLLHSRKALAGLWKAFYHVEEFNDYHTDEWDALFYEIYEHYSSQRTIFRDLLKDLAIADDE